MEEGSYTHPIWWHWPLFCSKSCFAPLHLIADQVKELVSKVARKPAQTQSILLSAALDTFKAKHPTEVLPKGDARLQQRAWDECVC